MTCWYLLVGLAFFHNITESYPKNEKVKLPTEKEKIFFQEKPDPTPHPPLLSVDLLLTDGISNVAASARECGTVVVVQFAGICKSLLL